MARAGATSVVCADMDLRFLEFAAKRATEMQDHAALEKQLLFRKVPHDSPELAPREVDLFVTKDTYHHLHKRSEYLMLVKKGLAVDGRVVIVDFKKKESPNGPPLEMRVSEMVVAQELELAGFKKVNIDSTTFAHHYVIEAINEE
jgi:predicted nicotinamide N-methyase